MIEFLVGKNTLYRNHPFDVTIRGLNDKHTNIIRNTDIKSIYRGFYIETRKDCVAHQLKVCIDILKEKGYKYTQVIVFDQSYIERELTDREKNNIKAIYEFCKLDANESIVEVDTNNKLEQLNIFKEALRIIINNQVNNLLPLKIFGIAFLVNKNSAEIEFLQEEKELIHLGDIDDNHEIYYIQY